MSLESIGRFYRAMKCSMDAVLEFQESVNDNR